MKGQCRNTGLAGLTLAVMLMCGCAQPSDNSTVAATTLILRSPEAVDGGTLPVHCSCDGDSSTLPLEWSGEPAGTKCFALVMYTIPSPGESHWYWVLYDIPAGVHSLASNMTGGGTLGTNSVNRRTEYAPPCSQGPGAKLYTMTLYALSEASVFSVPASNVSRDVLLSAIQDRTLASASMNLHYARQNGGQQ
jgi:phosphatidylethanolamine-binding protein (PEBP) family uncharacterized protein